MNDCDGDDDDDPYTHLYIHPYAYIIWYSIYTELYLFVSGLFGYLAYLKCCSGLVRDLWHSTIIAHRYKQIFCNRRRSHFHSPHILHRFSCADSQFIHIKISIWCYLILILHYIFIWVITSTDADNDNKVCSNKH